MVFASCENQDVDEIFDQSPEQRVSEQLNAVRADLKSNEMGWLTTYTCDEGARELVLVIKFIDDTRAEISAPEYDMKQESGYVLNYTQQVDLVFDTHSFLALLVDLKWKADFRWELDKQEDGQYFFNSVGGKSEGQSVMNMVKASPEKLQVAMDIQAFKAKMRPNYDISYFRVLELNSGERYDYSFINNKVIFEKPIEESVIRFESEITINDNSFVLTTPLVVDGKSISEFEYDEATGNFKIINSDDVEGGINFVNSPAIYPQAFMEVGTDVKDLRFYPWHTGDSSSKNFQSFFTNTQESLAASGYEFESFRIQWGYADKYNLLWVTIDGEDEYFMFDMVQKDGKIIFELTGYSIEDENLINGLMPFINFFFYEEGFYVKFNGQFKQYRNVTYLLISAKNASLGINFIEWL